MSAKGWRQLLRSQAGEQKDNGLHICIDFGNKCKSIKNIKGLHNMGYTRKQPCAKPHCPNFAEPNSSYCAEHKPQRPESRSKYKYMYNKKWQRASKNFLIKNWYCEECLKQGRYTPATEVHHRKDHKGDFDLFWDESNWEAICHSCHSRITMTNNNKEK